MKKLFLKRKLPNLIIIEGFWNIGKSVLVKYVENLNRYKHIKEPNHLTESIKKNISNWYIAKHRENLNEALNCLKKDEKIIMERSLISSISYQYATSGIITSRNVADLNKLKLISKDIGIIFLYGDNSFIYERSKAIKDKETKELISSKYFFKRYVEFYRKKLPLYLDNVKIIKINKGKSFKEQDKIIKLFYNYFPLLKKEKVVCSSMVAFYKNKVLLLYDHKYKHFVLPQGHKEVNEKLIETAIREMIEETGFKNLNVIKKIRKYQYHYPFKNKIIYKQIHVYLIEIISLLKIKKSLEKYENYSNKLFTFHEAIKRAKWQQDKEVIRDSLSYIKSPHFKKLKRGRLNCKKN